ncbi:MAG: SDR family oxidoreductase [Deltaproteobacteria bacterium]|nr:SDR family oxidoreductase [Deltaproteobacteria bacterium]
MFQSNLLAGEVVLITGGGTGLGRAMAERMGALGAKVGVVGRREDPLRETVEAIASAGGTAAWARCDVRDPQSVAAATDAIEAALGPVTALVNNAAGNFLACAEDLSANAFDAVVKIVLHGTFHCTSDLGRRWIARGSKGQVLSIVTTYAWTGSAFVLPSACAKAGVLVMTRSLAVEWATYGIRCNAIAPGPFPTEGAFSRLMPADAHDEALRQVPLGRFGEPAELANLASYLLSPMNAWMTGECVTLDGGEVLKAGQEFSRMTDYPRDELRAGLAMLRPPKSSKT